MFSGQADDALHRLTRLVARVADDDDVAPAQPFIPDRQHEYDVARVESRAHTAARYEAARAVERQKPDPKGD